MTSKLYQFFSLLHISGFEKQRSDERKIYSKSASEVDHRRERCFGSLVVVYNFLNQSGFMFGSGLTAALF